MCSVVDTNVLVVANNRDCEQATPACTREAVRQLRIIQSEGHLVLDQQFRILSEYRNQTNEDGQPGVGDAFLKWALTNQRNRQRCTLVSIREHPTRGFDEFPEDPSLDGFDPSDRKFAAVVRAHPQHPPVLNAVDTDWWHYRTPLQANGVQVDFLCEDVMRALQ